MSGSTGEDAMDAFKKAMGKLSAKKTAPEVSVPRDDDVQFIKSTKRKGSTSSAPAAAKRQTRASTQTSTPSPTPSTDLAKAVADLSSKVFPGSANFLQLGDIPKAIESIQIDLLQVYHCIYFVFF